MQTEDLKEAQSKQLPKKHLSRKLKRIQPMLLMEPMRLPGKRVRELLKKIISAAPAAANSPPLQRKP